MCYVIYRVECNGYICYDSAFTRCESCTSNYNIMSWNWTCYVLC